MYGVTFTDTALDNLKKFPDKDKILILNKIELLAQNPLDMPNVKKLVNFAPSYRLRAGNYRILFEREDNLKIIDIVDVLHRKQAYRRK